MPNGIAASDRSVNEALLLRQARFQPLGIVQGSAVCRPGLQDAPTFHSQELTATTQTLYEAREAAVARLVAEARALGADGVVGVRLEVQRYAWDALMTSFTVIGTAVRHPQGDQLRLTDNAPFTSALSGQDVWLLLHAGFRPLGVVMGSCVYHAGWAPFGQQVRQFGRNVEASSYTQAFYEARELALSRLQAEARDQGALGVVGTHVELGNERNYLVECFATGTAIATLPDGFEHPMPLPTPAGLAVADVGAPGNVNAVVAVPAVSLAARPARSTLVGEIGTMGEPVTEEPRSSAHRRFLDFGSLPLGLRLFTWAGLAFVVLAVLLLLGRDLPFAQLLVGQAQGQELRMGWPFLLVGVGLFILGWTCVLCSALAMRSRLSWLVLLAVTAAHGEFIIGGGAFPLGPAAAVALWGFFLLRHQRHASRWHQEWGEPIRDPRGGLLVNVLAVGLLVALMNLATPLMALANHDLSRMIFYPLAISFEVILLLVLLIPMLALAGLDLAEAAAQASLWTGRALLGYLPTGAGIAVILVGVAIKIALHVREGASWRAIALTTATMAAVVALLVQAPWRGESGSDSAESEAPPFGLLLVLAYGLFVVQIVAVGMVRLIPSDTDTLTHVSQFPVQINWAMAGVGAVVVALLVQARAQLRWQAPPSWAVFTLVWGLWVLATVGNPTVLWRPYTGLVTSLISLPGFDAAVSLLVVGALLALLSARRMTRGAMALGGAIVLTLTLLTAISSLYTDQDTTPTMLAVAETLVLIAVPLLTLLRLWRSPSMGSVMRAGVLALLVLLGLGVAAVLALAIAAQLHVLPVTWTLPPNANTVVLLAVALLWDFLASGGRFTNQSGNRLPREARVLLYLGYLALAASALLWTQSLHNAPGEIFNESVLPDYGLVVLGIPLVCSLWVSQGRRLLYGS